MWNFYLTVTGFNLSSVGISFISSCTSVRIFSCSNTHLPSFWFVSSSKVFVVSSSMISDTSSKFYTWDSNWLSSSIFFCCPPTSSSSFCVKDSTWVVYSSTSIMTYFFNFLTKGLKNIGLYCEIKLWLTLMMSCPQFWPEENSPRSPRKNLENY